ncbi:vitellogenin-1-like [Vipera latastei]
MKAVILALALTLVESVLTTDDILLYDYEFEVQNRMSEHGFSSAGLKAKCKAEIGNVQERKFLKVDCFEGLDYNGIYPWSKFVSSPKLTAVFQEHLKNVILTFQYRNGHVDDIMVPEHVSEFALNICKGILNLYENTIKKNQKTYNLKEVIPVLFVIWHCDLLLSLLSNNTVAPCHANSSSFISYWANYVKNGIEGMCDTTYLLQNTEKPDEFLVSKSKDLTNCDNMARKVVGAAYVTPCEFCRQKNRNFQGTRTYNYRMKDLKERDEKIILQATAQEIQQFTPFREETGETIIMEARQKLEFIEAHRRLPQIPSILKKHGSLLYSFKDSPQLPVPLLKIKNRNKEIEDGLRYLANENFPKDGKRFLQLVNLLRTENEINYSEVFDPYYSQPVYRTIVLDLIAAAGTSMGLRYVRHKIVQQEITTTEAAQTLLVFFHSSSAFEEVVEEAMAIMIEVLKGPQSLYRTTTCLAYGSLLSRFYAISDTIPEKYLKPLTDFATKAMSSSDIDASVLALKTFGNVRHIIVLKPIMKYLQNALPSDIRIQQNAIMALRNPAKKDPIRVQGILLPIIKNYKIAPLVRTCAAFVLLESKPTFPILMTVANAMVHEPSIQVENFVFMYLSTIAGSRSPEFRLTGPAYRMALKVLTQKSQRWEGHSISRYSLVEYFDEFYKARLGMYSMFLHEEENTQPTFIMTHFKALFMGSIFSPFETGVQIRRIKENSEVLQQVNKGHDSQQLQKTVFHEKGHLPWIKYLTDVLKNLPNIYWQKYIKSAEIQRIVPTCAGVPWQIGLVHIAHTEVDGNVQLLITPEPASQITWPDIINSDIKLKTRLRLRMKKDMILSVGIITPEIHALLEKKATVTANVPINMDVAMNIKEKTFKLELPPCKEETDIISLRMKTSAITSNIEEATAAVSTPVFFPANLSRTIVESFDRSSKKEDERKDTLPSEKKSAENLDAQLEKYLESFHQTQCFEACTFGCKACFHWADMYAGYLLRRSIYNYIGEYVFKFSLKESDPKVPIEKLRFTVQGGARVAEQMVHLLQNEEMDLVIKKLKKELGALELGNLHFRESQIDQSGNPLPYSEASSRNDSSWQEEEIIPGGVLLPYVTVVLEAVRSDNKKQGYSVSLYEKRDYHNVYFKIVAIIQKNPEREILFKVIEKAPDHQVAIIKVPGRTLYNDDFFPDIVSSGIPSLYYQNPKLSRFNVALWLSRGVEAVCEVQDEIIKTFDNKKFNTNIAKRECNLLIVKDCTTSDSYEPHFQIWIQYPKPGFPKEIHITINVTEITIQDSSGMLNVLHNEAPMPTNKEANIEILKTTNNVNVKAPEYGLESVTYDGVTLRLLELSQEASVMRDHIAWRATSQGYFAQTFSNTKHPFKVFVMDAPKVGLDNKEEPTSGTWEQGVAKHLEDSEPGGNGEKRGEARNFDRTSSWLTTGRKKYSCSQEAQKTLQKQTVEKGHSCNQ